MDTLMLARTVMLASSPGPPSAFQDCMRKTRCNKKIRESGDEASVMPLSCIWSAIMLIAVIEVYWPVGVLLQGAGWKSTVRPFTKPDPGTIKMTPLMTSFGEFCKLTMSSNYNLAIPKKVSSQSVLCGSMKRAWLSCRYTFRPDTGAVYGTQTQAYQSTVVIGAVKANSNSKISLVGYDGDVTWKQAANNTIEISMPSLPLDTELRWAWVFKFENIVPTTKR